MEGAAEAPVDAVPDGNGFAVGSWRLEWNAVERGFLLTSAEGDSENEAGRTTAAPGSDAALAPSSVLLADGRLFRLAWLSASDPRVEIGRWDVPGAYAIARPESGSWVFERTAAGAALEAPVTLWILAGAEIGRLDGWHEALG